MPGDRHVIGIEFGTDEMSPEGLCSNALCSGPNEGHYYEFTRVREVLDNAPAEGQRFLSGVVHLFLLEPPTCERWESPHIPGESPFRVWCPHLSILNDLVS